MSDAYVGEIRLFSGDFAPTGWALCDGSELPVAGNEDLFGLLGATFGGDGLNTFAVPDMRGRLPLHMGQGSGTSASALGTAGGQETVAVSAEQLPAHTHALAAKTSSGTAGNPSGNVLSASPSIALFEVDDPTTTLAPSVGTAGSDEPHDNMMPFVALNYIIAMTGFAE